MATRLAKVRLGYVRRNLLLDAGEWEIRLAGASHAVKGVTVSAGAFRESERQVRWRAARDLERLGLIKLVRNHGRRNDGGRHWHLLVAQLTDFGREVVEVFRKELEAGGRIRWNRLPVQSPATPDLHRATKKFSRWANSKKGPGLPAEGLPPQEGP